MRASVFAMGVALALLTGCSAPRAEAPSLESDDQKVLYALGLLISQNLAPLDFNEAELATIEAGLTDGAMGNEPKVDLQTFGPKVQGMLETRAAQATTREKQAGAEYCTKAAAEPGAVTTESGVVYFELQPGTGAAPGPADTVKIHYHGTLRDGKVFDSSLEREPATFALNAVIKCFSEGVQKMKVGGKSKIVCPSDTAYGDRGRPPMIPGGAPLVFEITLLEVVGSGAVPSEPPSAP
jgi:FKBP-type peptidyl-prolyl cis-trans isomerase FkpA/FKBP-type peptidyl-prolyl cis-trans isomerase FklB